MVEEKRNENTRTKRGGENQEARPKRPLYMLTCKRENQLEREKAFKRKGGKTIDGLLSLLKNQIRNRFLSVRTELGGKRAVEPIPTSRTCSSGGCWEQEKERNRDKRSGSMDSPQST